MGKLFGTDGVRGAANSELTPELAFNLGRAGAYVLTKANYAPYPHIIIGTDSRISGDMLESALTAGMCSVGANVMCAGVIPTPAIAYLARSRRLDAGIVVSASHNKFGDNGIKFFGGGGFKLRDDLENEIEEIILSGKADSLPRVKSAFVGRRVDTGAPENDYVDYLEKTAYAIKPDISLEGMKIALDCANGAASFAAPKLFRRLGAELLLINDKPNGININENCGSTHVDGLVRAVTENGCDMGIAFDGDGDRLICVDGGGNIVDGDFIMAICGLYMKETGRLPQKTIVATVMSNLGLHEMGAEHGITVEQTHVGDKFVIQRMLEGGFRLGGEQSGHIILSQYATTGDGLLAAVMLLCAMRHNNASLNELAKAMAKFPQVLINVPVPTDRKRMHETNEFIQKRIQELETKYKGMGRVLIRPSGTEPLVRVMIEGKDIAEITEDAKVLAADIEKAANR
jgi:phosphoglucosamine mutase